MSFRADIQGWYKTQLLTMTDLCYELECIDEAKDLLSVLNKNADAMMHAEVINTLLKNEEAIVTHLKAKGTDVAVKLSEPIQALLRLHRTFAYSIVEMVDQGGIEIPDLDFDEE